nr:hypothetical protein [Tanacetum cinerariifolium]
MTYPVTILTLDSVRSYVMQGASFTQGIVSSIPIGGSISPRGFLPSILLLVVIMVVVVIVVVTVILVVIVVVKLVIVIVGVVVIVGDISSILKLSFVIIVVDEIIGVIVVVGGVSSIIKLSFVIIGVSLGLVFLLVFSVFATVATCVSRAAATLSATNFLMAT